MPKQFTDEEYHKQLPKKQVGTAILFFNELKELLILKPDYKESWLIPGGSADEGESPLTCAIRETREEIGLTILEMKLIGVYHSPGKGFYSDSLKFIFYGGKLSENQIKKIQLQKEEFESCKFESIENAIPLLSNSLQKSIPQCLEAINNDTFAYIEAD